MKPSMNLRWILGGLCLGFHLGPAAAMPQDATTSDVADVQASEDVESGVESPVSNPEVGEAPVLDESTFLLGDWGDWRSARAAEGISFDVQWTQHAQGVVDGGTDTSFRYGGTLDYLIEFDLGAMDVLPGAFVKVLAESRYGESVNGDTGGLLPASTDLSFPLTDLLDDNVALTVTELSFAQFLSPSFGVVLGKFQTLDGDANEFASGRGRSQFLNASLVFNPVTSLMVPYSTLGGGVVVLPAPNVTIVSMVSNTTDASTTTGFSDIGDGWTWTTEAQFQYRFGGLPGGQNVAFIYAADNTFLNFNRSGIFPDGVLLVSEDDTWAAYWSGWQYLHTPDEVPDRIDITDGRADLRGVGLFARFGIADDDTNPIAWSFSAGLGGRGILPGRDDDTFGLGFAYTDIDRGAFASALGFDEEAYGFEAFYNIAMAPGVALTLDGQVINPVFDGVETATILGARLNIRF